MKSMSISVILDWIPDKYRIFYKSTGLDQLFRHARMLDDSMEIIDNDFLYLTQESSFLDREWDIRKPRFLIFCTKTGSKEGQINPSWLEKKEQSGCKERWTHNQADLKHLCFR